MQGMCERAGRGLLTDIARNRTCLPVVNCVPLPPCQVVLPPTVPASLSYLSSSGAYLLDNGQLLVLWLGRDAEPGWLVQVHTRDQAIALLRACRPQALESTCTTRAWSISSLKQASTMWCVRVCVCTCVRVRVSVCQGEQGVVCLRSCSNLAP